MNTVIMLNRDLKAKAGQFLVVRADGGVFAVDPDMLSLILHVAPAHRGEPAAELLNRKEAANRAREMIIAGNKTREIAKMTGLANATIYRYRSEMSRKGLIPGRKKKDGHHFYKTPEALEKARQRGENMKNARPAKETV
jgi:hypothetical protein